MPEFIPEYREISYMLLVAPSDLEQVKLLLASHSWEIYSQATCAASGLVNIQPRPVPPDHQSREGMQVLWDLAPYVQAESRAILEIRREPKPWEPVWLHLTYDGKGGVSEQETPAHQWDANTAR